MTGLVPVVPYTGTIKNEDDHHPDKINHGQGKAIANQFIMRGKLFINHVTPFETAQRGRKHGQQMDQVYMKYIKEHRRASEYKEEPAYRTRLFFGKCKENQPTTQCHR